MLCAAHLLGFRLIWFGLWGIFVLMENLDPTYASTYPALIAATALLIWGDPSIKPADLAAHKIGMKRSTAFLLLGTRKEAEAKIKQAVIATRPKRPPAKKSRTKPKK